MVTQWIIRIVKEKSDVDDKARRIVGARLPNPEKAIGKIFVLS
jgi:hypothetical protein